MIWVSEPEGGTLGKIKSEEASPAESSLMLSKSRKIGEISGQCGERRA